MLNIYIWSNPLLFRNIISVASMISCCYLSWDSQMPDGAWVMTPLCFNYLLSWALGDPVLTPATNLRPERGNKCLVSDKNTEQGDSEHWAGERPLKLRWLQIQGNYWPLECNQKSWEKGWVWLNVYEHWLWRSLRCILDHLSIPRITKSLPNPYRVKTSWLLTPVAHYPCLRGVGQ